MQLHNLSSVGKYELVMLLFVFWVMSLAAMVESFWQRLRQKRAKRAEYVLTIVDEDGMPIVHRKLTIDDVAELVSVLNQSPDRWP